MSFGKTTTPTQPSPTPISAESHVGASTQKELERDGSGPARVDVLS
jgi:hypothetical protein